MPVTISDVRLLGLIGGYMAVVSVLAKQLVALGFTDDDWRRCHAAALEEFAKRRVEGIPPETFDLARDAGVECIRSHLDPDSLGVGRTNFPVQ